MNNVKVYFVDAANAEPDRLDPKTQHILCTADVVLHDASASPAVLALIRPSAGQHNVGVAGSLASMTQQEICARMVTYATEGFMVVRLKGDDAPSSIGTMEETGVLRACGIEYEVLPAHAASEQPACETVGAGV